MLNISIPFPNSKTFYLLLFIYLFVNNKSLSQPQWNLISPQVDGNIDALYFVNANVGWSSANNNIYKSTDGGITFNIQSSGMSFTEASFIDENNGYIINSNEIYFSSDGGNNWLLRNDSIGGSLNQVKAINENMVFISGSSGLFKSTDNGSNWDTLIINKNIKFLSIFNNNLWAITSDSLYKSTDGGNNWVKISDQGLIDGSTNLKKIVFIDSLNGIIINDNNETYLSSDDGGLSWLQSGFEDYYNISDAFYANNGQKIFTANLGAYNSFTGLESGIFNITTGFTYYTFNRNLTKIIGIDENNMWAIGDNSTILKFNSVSNQWDYLSFSGNNYIVGIKTINDSTAISIEDYHNFHVGFDRQIIILKKTYNYGRSWSMFNNFLFYKGDSNDYITYQFINDQIGYIFWSSIVYKTTNGGANWQQKTSINIANEFIFFLSDSVGWVLGTDQLIKTTDSGLTWSNIFNSSSGYKLSSIYFLDEDNGFATADYGGNDTVLYKTTDGGYSWESQSINNNHKINSVKFINSNTGFVLADSGNIFRTTDTGTSWTKLSTNSIDNLNSLKFINNEIWVGGTSSIIKTTDIGETWNDTEFPESVVSDFSPSSSGSAFALSGNKFLQYDNEMPVPVELISFSGNYIEKEKAVKLNWSTASELSNYGFEVQRKINNGWERIGFINGHSHSNSIKYYSFTDDKIENLVEAGYRLKQIDFNGTYKYSNEIEIKY